MVKIIVASIVLLAAAAPFLLTHTCTAFQSLHPITLRSRSSTFIVCATSNNDDVPSEAGQDLANQFFKQLKERAAQENPKDDGPKQPPSQEITQQSSDQDFLIQQDSPPQPPARKFTGASPSLFSERTSSNLEREQEREFNLVGTFERTLGIQVAILFASIVFVASVGLTGGIKNGSERYFGGADELDDTEIHYNMQTDDAAEAMRRQSTQESRWL